jgi:elongation factor Ts
MNENFVKLATDLANQALNFETKEAFLAADFNGITVADKLIEQTGVIGEKIEIRSFEKLEGAFIGSYIHSGNKIATLVALSANIAGADEVARNVSMQAAAMAPIALNEAGVDSATIAKEIEIAKDVLRQEGKPEAMLDSIAKGKMTRFFKDNTLVNQDYIKDGKMSVATYVQSLDKNLVVTGFKRAALG